MDSGLVERAQQGDREAFGLLAVPLGDRLFAIASRILRDDDLASDATPVPATGQGQGGQGGRGGEDRGGAPAPFAPPAARSPSAEASPAGASSSVSTTRSSGPNSVDSAGRGRPVCSATTSRSTPVSCSAISSRGGEPARRVRVGGPHQQPVEGLVRPEDLDVVRVGQASPRRRSCSPGSRR